MSRKPKIFIHLRCLNSDFFCALDKALIQKWAAESNVDFNSDMKMAVSSNSHPVFPVLR